MQDEGDGVHRPVDIRDVRGEPARQEDVSDGAALGAEAFGDAGEGAAEAIAGVDGTLAADDNSRDRRLAVALASSPL